MTYTVIYKYVDQDLHYLEGIPVHSHGKIIRSVRWSASGSFPDVGGALAPGKLSITAQAVYKIIHEGWHTGPSTETIKYPLPVQIKTPDGQLFTSDHVTRNDLEKYRDLPGSSQGSWSYTVPLKEHKFVLALEDDLQPQGHLSITIEETVTSQSAPPLVSDHVFPQDQRRYTFDLYRVGVFVATTKSKPELGGSLVSKTINLFDPDGIEVATSNDGRLTFPVPLEVLEKSRDTHGNARLWSLKVGPSVLSPTAEAFVWASVIATARIRTATLKSRIDWLIGVGGNKVSIYGDMRQETEELLVRLKILDKYSAETLFVALGVRPYKVFKPELQDPGVDISEFQANVPYVLYSRSRNFPYETHVSLNGVKVKKINIVIGASVHIQPSIPAMKLEVLVEGNATVKLGGFPIATVSVNNNKIALEVGMRLNADGTFSAETWINDSPINIDVSWEAAVAAGVISLGLLTLGAEGLAKVIESHVNDTLIQFFRDFLKAEVPAAVTVGLAIIQGGHFTYQSMRIDGNDIILDYIAPLEPDPKPSQNYTGVIGRSPVGRAGDHFLFVPPTLGNTWTAQNLNKIDHIVVVMMENRSFDHVLGYRAQLPGAQNADGLTKDLTDFLTLNSFSIPNLDHPWVLQNISYPKTKFPLSVGHHVADVTMQLSERLTQSSGRTILSPKGFVDNFKANHSELSDMSPVTLKDVVGYYTGDDLPFTKFLADNYAYCERYFSSHPGPTLPNRMFWLSGDLEHDRTGEAVLDNTNDKFQLSRAMTIFDVLTRKRISWRMYESFPSVAMLRCFARYATDVTNIVPISRLQQDVAHGNIPAVTVIEPAMHHSPENDDHPIADMYYGQLFLKCVYDTLRSNSTLWQKTMLIITYDEHGGFYDHVVPPIADVRTSPMVIAPNSLNGASDAVPTDKPTLWTSYGVRVPTFVVSPWTPAGKGPDIVLDHCSIIKTILARFCGQDRPFVSDRVNASRSFDAYLSEQQPRMNVPVSPPLTPLPGFNCPFAGGSHDLIETESISGKKMRRGNVEFHDLTGMLARILGR